MPSVLADRTVDLLEDLPPYLAADAYAQATLDPLVREFDRIEQSMTRLRDKMMPQLCDDEFRTAALWETILELPVEPTGVSIEERRALILSHIRKRTASSSADWVDSLTNAIGSEWGWELGPGVGLTIRLPVIEGTFTAGQVYALARAITPAHLPLTVLYGEGFIVGEGLVGIDSL